jgi:hypothetical protein
VQYLLMLYGDETAWNRMSEAEVGAMLGDYETFTQSLRDAGAFVGGEALQGTNTAQTVRVQGEETIVTAGPYAETVEQLGGYYLIEAADLDEAIAAAARIPAAHTGTVEVRPLARNRVEA